MACIASTAGPERQGGNYLCPRQARPDSTKADGNAARKSKRSQHLRLAADGIGNACHGATGWPLHASHSFPFKTGGITTFS